MRSFLIKIVVFFIPIIVCYLVVENHLRSLPTIVSNKANYYNIHKNDIEILILGASRNKDAINPTLISKNTLNLAISAQDYYISNRLLQKVAPNLPKLKTVIIPCTFAHFESGPSQKKTWRNSMYRYYFNISLEDRFTYFKDNFMYKDNATYYQTLIDKYADGTFKKDSSTYPTDINNYLFPKMKYDSLKIVNNEFIIQPETAHPEYIKENIKSLENILAYCLENNYNIIINDTPLSIPYKQKIIPEIKKRRDSILSLIQKKYNFLYFNPYNDVKFNLEDFRDYNHLSPSGAEKYTTFLVEFLKNKC